MFTILTILGDEFEIYYYIKEKRSHISFPYPAGSYRVFTKELTIFNFFYLGVCGVGSFVMMLVCCSDVILVHFDSFKFRKWCPTLKNRLCLFQTRFTRDIELQDHAIYRDNFVFSW
jgi:hypothetical protein